MSITGVLDFFSKKSESETRMIDILFKLGKEKLFDSILYYSSIIGIPVGTLLFHFVNPHIGFIVTGLAGTVGAFHDLLLAMCTAITVCIHIDNDLKKKILKALKGECTTDEMDEISKEIHEKIVKHD